MPAKGDTKGDILLFGTQKGTFYFLICPQKGTFYFGGQKGTFYFLICPASRWVSVCRYGGPENQNVPFPPFPGVFLAHDAKEDILLFETPGQPRELGLLVRRAEKAECPLSQEP